MERGGIVLGCHGGGVVVRRCCRAEGGVGVDVRGTDRCGHFPMKSTTTIPVPSFEQGPHSNSHAMSQCEDFETSRGKRDTSMTTGIFFISLHNAFSSRKVHEHVDRGYYI